MHPYKELMSSRGKHLVKAVQPSGIVTRRVEDLPLHSTSVTSLKICMGWFTSGIIAGAHPRWRTAGHYLALYGDTTERIRISHQLGQHTRTVGFNRQGEDHLHVLLPAVLLYLKEIWIVCLPSAQTD